MVPGCTSSVTNNTDVAYRNIEQGQGVSISSATTKKVDGLGKSISEEKDFSSSGGYIVDGMRESIHQLDIDDDTDKEEDRIEQTINEILYTADSEDEKKKLLDQLCWARLTDLQKQRVCEMFQEIFLENASSEFVSYVLEYITKNIDEISFSADAYPALETLVENEQCLEEIRIQGLKYIGKHFKKMDPSQQGSAYVMLQRIFTSCELPKLVQSGSDLMLQLTESTMKTWIRREPYYALEYLWESSQCPISARISAISNIIALLKTNFDKLPGWEAVGGLEHLANTRLLYSFKKAVDTMLEQKVGFNDEQLGLQLNRLLYDGSLLLLGKNGDNEKLFQSVGEIFREIIREAGHKKVVGDAFRLFLQLCECEAISPSCIWDVFLDFFFHAYAVPHMKEYREPIVEIMKQFSLRHGSLAFAQHLVTTVSSEIGGYYMGFIACKDPAYPEVLREITAFAQQQYASTTWFDENLKAKYEEVYLYFQK